jgi:hypothetical protein
MPVWVWVLLGVVVAGALLATSLPYSVLMWYAKKSGERYERKFSQQRKMF